MRDVVYYRFEGTTGNGQSAGKEYEYEMVAEMIQGLCCQGRVIGTLLIIFVQETCSMSKTYREHAVPAC